MVLIKVVKLVIDVDWLRNVTIDVDNHSAKVWDICAAFVILFDYTLDFLTHDVEGDAECQEYQAKNAKDNHCGAKGRHGPPGGQHLLLELALLKLLDLLLDAHQIFLGDFHFQSH